MSRAQLVGVVAVVLSSLSLTSGQIDQSSSTSSTPGNSCTDTYPSYCAQNTNKCIDRYPNVLKYCQKTCNRCSTTSSATTSAATTSAATTSPATTSPATTLPSVTSTKNTPTKFDVQSSTKVLSTYTTTYDRNTNAPLNTVTSVGTLSTAYLVTWLGTMICIVHTWTILQE